MAKYLIVKKVVSEGSTISSSTQSTHSRNSSLWHRSMATGDARTSL